VSVGDHNWSAGRRRFEVGIAPHLPPLVVALADIATGFERDSWGGPFNGQRGRQDLFREIVEAIRPPCIVETGAFRGTTTAFLRAVSGAPVYTVESQPRYYHYCRMRFLRDPGIRVVHGDSRGFLRDAARDPTLSKRNVVFYLDAHWDDDLPLDEELRLIAETWRGSVVMVDDFQVPDDPGYAWDDWYPAARTLKLENVPAATSGAYRLFWPSLPSKDETGARRGLLVLAQEETAGAVGGLRGLRPLLR
jgi:hypothetical protein